MTRFYLFCLACFLLISSNSLAESIDLEINSLDQETLALIDELKKGLNGGSGPLFIKSVITEKGSNPTLTQQNTACINNADGGGLVLLENSNENLSDGKLGLSPINEEGCLIQFGDTKQAGDKCKEANPPDGSPSVDGDKKKCNSYETNNGTMPAIECKKYPNGNTFSLSCKLNPPSKTDCVVQTNSDQTFENLNCCNPNLSSSLFCGDETSFCGSVSTDSSGRKVRMCSTKNPDGSRTECIVEVAEPYFPGIGILQHGKFIKKDCTTTKGDPNSGNYTETKCEETLVKDSSPPKTNETCTTTVYENGKVVSTTKCESIGTKDSDNDYIKRCTTTAKDKPERNCIIKSETISNDPKKIKVLSICGPAESDGQVMVLCEHEYDSADSSKPTKSYCGYYDNDKKLLKHCFTNHLTNVDICIYPSDENGSVFATKTCKDGRVIQIGIDNANVPVDPTQRASSSCITKPNNPNEMICRYFNENRTCKISEVFPVGTVYTCLTDDGKCISYKLKDLKEEEIDSGFCLGLSEIDIKEFPESINELKKYQC